MNFIPQSATILENAHQMIFKFKIATKPLIKVAIVGTTSTAYPSRYHQHTYHCSHIICPRHCMHTSPSRSYFLIQQDKNDSNDLRQIHLGTNVLPNTHVCQQRTNTCTPKSTKKRACGQSYGYTLSVETHKRASQIISTCTYAQ